MLTRELLISRVYGGKLRPSFVSRDDPALRELAGQLVSVAEGARGQTRDDIEEALAARAGAYWAARVAKGLVKLLLDRLVFEEPPAEIAQAREERLRTAAGVLRELPPDATIELYEARLRASLDAPLDEVRASLYADLPGSRRMIGWDALSPVGLLDRYNLALAQGPLLGAKRMTLRAQSPELLRVRKVLRWLKLCRLVAEVRRDGEDWQLDIEGPGAVLALQKGYGLQLASFLSVVPVLERWSIAAEVGRKRRPPVTLALDHRDPLVSPHSSALGHIPPEVATLAQSFADDAWSLDLTPLPRHVGASGLCVPDMLFRHRDTGREVALELFHAWHAGALDRRLEQLCSRPDPDLLLGVDRSLVKGAEARRQALEAHPQVLLFNGFPSAKRLKERLDRGTPARPGAASPAGCGPAGRS